MKKVFFIIPAFLILFLSGCIKGNNSADPLTGSWRLTEVYDKNASTTLYPPSGATTDIIITFAAGHRFYGHTLKNSFGDGSYTISGGNRIRFGSYITTEVAEDSWGQSFYESLTCIPETSGSCTPSEFTVQGATLKFITPTRYDLTLVKL